MSKKHLLQLFLASSLCFGISTSFAQTVNKVFKNAPLRTVLTQIEQQTGCSVVYKHDDVNENQKVTLNLKDVPVVEALQQILGSTYEVKLKNKMLIITLKRKNTETSPVSDKKIEITGTILDEHGEPLIGAVVSAKGLSLGISTDINGNYHLKNVPENAILKVSSLGYISQEYAATDNRLKKIVLKENKQQLNEVVVVGYGSQKKANLTGAVASIGADEINKRPVASAAGALQGADPSVNLTLNSGSLDADYKIDIRGVASINGGSPLILADGMEVSLNQINPNDIESISVLKDASAASIYGAKASSGVILITTKKGQNNNGKATITYNGRIGWRQNTTTTDFISNGYDYVSLINRFYSAYNNKPWFTYDDEEMQYLLDRKNDHTEQVDRPWVMTNDNGQYLYYANFDWYNYLFRTTRPEQEQNISVAGGNSQIKYFASGRFLTQDGIFKIYPDRYYNYSFRVNLQSQLSKKLSLTTNVNLNINRYQYAGYEDEQQTMYFLNYNVYPNVVPTNPDGSIVQYINQTTGNSPLGGGHAGFLTANMARNSRQKRDFIVSNQLDYQVFNDLVLTASYAYKVRNDLNKHRNMPFSYSRQQGITTTFTSGTIYDYYKENHSEFNDHNLNLYATYSHSLRNSHHIKALIGTQYEDYRKETLSVKRNDLLSQALSSLSVATGESVIRQEIGAFRTLGFFSRLNYDFMGKYLVELSGRWDGTSRFAAQSRWGFFPSASLGWRVSEEHFFQPLQSFWNNAKLRLSIGSLGNQQVNYYSYFNQISTDNLMSYTFDGQNRSFYAKVSDPISDNLTWETVKTYNLGVDMSFFKNRLTLTADFFVRKTENMLTRSLTLPSVYGAPTPKANSADLRTTGYEIYLSWNDRLKLNGKDLTYSIAATLGDYQSVITKFNNPQKLISDYYVGMKIGEIWGYHVEGLFRSDEEAAAYQANINDRSVNGRIYNSKVDNYLRAGDLRFADLDGDKLISEGSGTVSHPGDKKIIGNSLPRYSYSLRLGATYEGFDLSVFFQGIGKQNWYPTYYSYNFWGPYTLPMVSFIEKNFANNVWQADQPNAYFPRPRGYQAGSGGALNTVNDRYLQNAAYLRLKNLSLGYTFVLKNNIAQSIRIYFTGENLFYWSPLKKYTRGIDPELVNSTATYQPGSGLGYGFSKSFSFGIDVKF